MRHLWLCFFYPGILWYSLPSTLGMPRGQRQSFSSSTLRTLAQLMSCNYVLIISVGHHSVHSSSLNEDILKTFGSLIIT